jgi:hypothetical protein
MIQLNPTLPIIRISDGMKGYAFLVIDYSQEHDLLFTCAMDNGEIWTALGKYRIIFKKDNLYTYDLIQNICIIWSYDKTFVSFETAYKLCNEHFENAILTSLI